VAEKPAFRQAVRERRCLVPADGFYEWTKDAEGRRLPWWVRPSDGPPEGRLLAFAGVWELWRGPEGERVAACAIVTGPAGPEIAHIHHRAPVMIRPQDYALWLGEEGRGAARLLEPGEGIWAAHRVSTRVNGVKDDDPQLIEPVEG
jgi:putative SOS response-associated peptidase YedK